MPFNPSDAASEFYPSYEELLGISPASQEKIKKFGHALSPSTKIDDLANDPMYPLRIMMEGLATPLRGAGAGLNAVLGDKRNDGIYGMTETRAEAGRGYKSEAIRELQRILHDPILMPNLIKLISRTKKFPPIPPEDRENDLSMDSIFNSLQKEQE